MKLKIVGYFIFIFLVCITLYGFIYHKTDNTFRIPTPGIEDSITVCRNGLNIPIQDNQSSFDTININGIPSGNLITGVEVTLDTIIHTWDSDLGITIQKGNSLDSLVNNRGGSGDNFIGTKFTDTASTPISAGSSPFTGFFRAESPLSIFNSLDPNGFWILEIYDNFSGDQGTLKAWCITIHYEESSGFINNQNYYPFKFSLSQNYPNPFNPITMINFSIAKSGLVSLKVFDVLGKEVATLVNDQKVAGSYSIKFDGTDLSSGVYFYKMVTKEFTGVKKMLLIK